VSTCADWCDTPLEVPVASLINGRSAGVLTLAQAHWNALKRSELLKWTRKACAAPSPSDARRHERPSKQSPQRESMSNLCTLTAQRGEVCDGLTDNCPDITNPTALPSTALSSSSLLSTQSVRECDLRQCGPAPLQVCMCMSPVERHFELDRDAIGKFQ
jgi:hypothetical protein